VWTILRVENRACLLVIQPIYRHLIFPLFINSYFHIIVVSPKVKWCFMERGFALHSQPQDVLAIMRGSRKAPLDEQAARGHHPPNNLPYKDMSMKTFPLT
jgi:hypothetical protein